ncbi:MAG: adenosylcobinamide-GDP ribazoletransferase, partial [Caldimicrobium sp.]
MLKYPLMAFSFLWRLPVKSFFTSEEDFKGALSFFPLVGAMEGLFLSLFASLLSKVLLSEFLALLLIVFIFYIRGIFHLDGLSDTFDALAYKGTGDMEKDRVKRLQIMKDSTVGVAGVVTITLSLFAKFFFIKELLIFDPHLLFLPFLFSRGFLLWIIFFSKSAKNEGLGYLMKKYLTLSGLLGGTVISFMLILIFEVITGAGNILRFIFLILFNFIFLFLF